MAHPYDTLHYGAHLSFGDAFGLDAIFDCYQRIRVLADAITVVPQSIWGDGDQFSDFVSPAAPVMQVLPTNGRKVALLGLERLATRGEEVEIISRRRIHHGFKDFREWWEFSPISQIEGARLTIDFPIGREPDGIQVQSLKPGAPSPSVFRPGTKQLVFKVSRPPVGSLYRIDWSW